uniref:Uncharacterized protein n=1 Tax=Tanacetum cinerariifolium TaxID=118510 RepID=A0A699JIB6_TANCI|nr:hypothetical protein [Tanacetum cinerariifolium]
MAVMMWGSGRLWWQPWWDGVGWGGDDDYDGGGCGGCGVVKMMIMLEMVAGGSGVMWCRWVAEIQLEIVRVAPD